MDPLEQRIIERIQKDAVTCKEKEIGFRINGEEFCFPSSTAKHMYIEDNEIVRISPHWNDDNYPDAKQIRDSTARRLRKVGYDVKSTTWNFTDLARSYMYRLEATNKKWKWATNKGWVRQ